MSSSAVAVTLTGALVAGLVLAIGLERDVELGALIGAAVSTAFGWVALWQKGRAPEMAEGAAGIKHLLSAQVVTLLLRLAAVLVGGLAVKRQGLEPMAYVVAFFVCSMVQQLIEVKFMLAANKTAGVVEARS